MRGRIALTPFLGLLTVGSVDPSPADEADPAGPVLGICSLIKLTDEDGDGHVDTYYEYDHVLVWDDPWCVNAPEGRLVQTGAWTGPGSLPE